MCERCHSVNYHFRCGKLLPVASPYTAQQSHGFRQHPERRLTLTIFDLLSVRTDQRWKEATIEDAVTRVQLGDLANRVDERATALRAAGVRVGDRVLISYPNSVDWVISALAVMRLGAIAAPIDPGATAREIASYEGIIDPVG